jgi:hypothetical protein
MRSASAAGAAETAGVAGTAATGIAAALAGAALGACFGEEDWDETETRGARLVVVLVELDAGSSTFGLAFAAAGREAPEVLPPPTRFASLSAMATARPAMTPVIIICFSMAPSP